MSDMKDFVYQTPRMLPVILLLDTSGSMNNNSKISALNMAVRNMLGSFKAFHSAAASISVAVITFGGSAAKVHLNLTAADELNIESISNMTADGNTPMGHAVELAKGIIEDRDQISSRAYRPTVVLVSDGMPNDRGWREAIEDFKTTGRSSKCCRMAMGIGVGRDSEEYDVLQSFTGDPEQIFTAADANDIGRFFQFVTMSTTSRAKSADTTPVASVKAAMEKSANTAEEQDEDDEDDDDLDVTEDDFRF